MDVIQSTSSKSPKPSLSPSSSSIHLNDINQSNIIDNNNEVEYKNLQQIYNYSTNVNTALPFTIPVAVTTVLSSVSSSSSSSATTSSPSLLNNQNQMINMNKNQQQQQQQNGPSLLNDQNRSSPSISCISSSKLNFDDDICYCSGTCCHDHTTNCDTKNISKKMSHPNHHHHHNHYNHHHNHSHSTSSHKQQINNNNDFGWSKLTHMIANHLTIGALLIMSGIIILLMILSSMCFAKHSQQDNVCLTHTCIREGMLIIIV